MAALRFYQALAEQLGRLHWGWLLWGLPSFASLVSGAVIWQWQRLMNQSTPEAWWGSPGLIGTAAAIAFLSTFSAMAMTREQGTPIAGDRSSKRESADLPDPEANQPTPIHTDRESIGASPNATPPGDATLDRAILAPSPAVATPPLPTIDGRFVPIQFLHLLQRSSLEDVQLGDCIEKTVAVMFADIRGFTTLSESMSPQQNLKFLNAYLGRMERVIAQNNGFIDKYIGDAIMALFEGDPDQSVEAAIAMLHALNDYNQERIQAGRSPIRIGIGLDVGPLILGTIGGIHRMETTAIGDAVNLASRLEELTKEYSVSILVSHRMLAAMRNPSKYSIRFIDRLYVRGRTQPVAVYEVLNADPIEAQTLKRAAASRFEEGVLRFHRRQYREAAAVFEECLTMNPTDRATHIYLQRSVLAGFPPSEHTWQLVKGKVIHKRKCYRGRYRARSR